MRRILLGAMALVFISGCSEDNLDKAPRRTVQIPKYQGQSDSHFKQGTARMVKIDGMECILVDGYRQFGITCDWTGARK